MTNDLSRMVLRIALGLALLLPHRMLADSLSGRVLDPDGLAAPGVKVSLVNRNNGELRQTATSDSGAFDFPNIPGGNYLLEAQAGDAALSGQTSVNVDGAESVDLRLRLAATATQVVVTATGTPLSQLEIAKVIDVVDSQQINHRVEYAVAEVLRTVPGVQIQTPIGGLTQIKTRGLRNEDTAVLIDGLRFRDASAPAGDASGFLSDMNVVDLGRAEYLRGSGSSLYGSNAIAGAVSLNSNEGGGPTHGSLRAEGGGLGLFRGTANLAGGLANDRLVYSAGLSHLNVTGGVRGKTPNRNTSGQGFAKWKLAPRISLSGRFWGSDVFQRSVDSPTFTPQITANFPASGPVTAIALPDSQLALYEQRLPFSAGNATFIPSVPDPDASRASSFRTAAAVFRYELSPVTALRVSYQGVATNRAFYDGPAGRGSLEPLQSQVSNSDGRTDLLQVRLDTRAGRANLITAGYELERESLTGLAARVIGGREIRTEAGQLSHSYYAQDQIRLVDDKLQIAIGGRIQHFSLGTPTFTGTAGPYETATVRSPGNAFTGDISAAYYVPSSNTKFRGHVGNSYRAPSVFNRYGSGYSEFTGSFTYYGDPSLKPERSIAFDGGVDQWLFDARMRASATFFYTDLTESIIFDFANFPANDPFGRTGGYRNSSGGGIARGVELSAQFSPVARTSVQASYTYVNADQRTPTIGANFFSALRTANHIVSLTGTQRLTRRLNVTVDFYAVGDTSESPFGSGGRRFIFAGPKKTDVVANYNLPLSDTRSVDFYGKFENVFDVSYTDNGFYAPGAWATGGLKFNF